ncbi:hypothetical protein [Streptomyces albidoflavus]|uniref:hypothetical protein n=1 Tax=Streptomyces albidoflavus TaxID=1886 RepID=UPI00339DF007
MRAWRRHLALLASGAALCLAAVTPASGAEPGWAVGPVSPAAFTAQNEGNFVRSLNQLPETCTHVTMSGSLSSTNAATSPVGAVTAAAYAAPGKPCTSVMGNIVRSPQPGWKLVAEKYDPATGVTSGRITDYVERSIVGATRWTTAGEIPWTYENNTGRWKLNASGTDLTVVASQYAGAWLPVGSSIGLKGTLLLKIPGTSTPPTITPQT